MRHLHAGHADGGRGAAAPQPAPGRGEVEDALGGVLCRCTGYRKIVEAVLDAPATPAAAPVPRGRRRGRRAPRAGRRRGQGDGPRALRRRRLPGRRAVDPRRARAACAARASRSATSTPAAASPASPPCSPRPTCPAQRLRHLSRHQGPAGAGRRPGALPRRGGAGAGRRARRRARRSRDDDLPIAWTPEPPLYGIDAATARRTRRWCRPTGPDNLLMRRRRARAAMSPAAFAGCAAVAEGAFETAFVEHAYIEPEAGCGRARRRPHRDPRLAPRRPTWTATRSRSVMRPAARGGAHRADRLRRRLRRQARPVAAAAARPRGLEARAGRSRCVYTRPECMAADAPSAIRRAMRAPLRLRCRRQAHGLRRSTATSTPAPMPAGGRPSPTACRCMPPGPMPCRNVRDRGRGRATPTARPPAPSAASACRRPPSPTRR